MQPTAADFEAHGWSPSAAAELDRIERDLERKRLAAADDEWERRARAAGRITEENDE